MAGNLCGLDVCRLAKKLSFEVLQESLLFPQKESYEFIRQIRRSTCSMPAQIAESMQIETVLKQ